MLLEKRSRFFLRFELTFRGLRDNGFGLPFISSDDTLDVHSTLQKCIASQSANLILKDLDVVDLTHLTIFEDQGLAALLFRRRNADAAEQIFDHRVTRELRASGKRSDEDVATSAHLFIKLAPQGGNTHAAVLEEVPGLGRTYIEGVIGKCLRESPYSVKDRRGQPKETRTVLEVKGIQSETLGEALKEGAISIVELVRPAKAEGLDDHGDIAPREERMKLAVKVTQGEGLGIIRRIKAWATKHDWKEVRVQIRLPEERSRVVSISREMDAADVLFVRSEQVFVKRDLPTCTDQINMQLLAEAAKMLNP